MDELKPCPFCGCMRVAVNLEPYIGGGGFGYCAECDKCWSKTGYYSSKAEAIEAWNARAERACHMEYNEDWSGVELYPTEAYRCSACGHITQEGLPNYCPKCGAKAVDE